MPSSTMRPTVIPHSTLRRTACALFFVSLVHATALAQDPASGSERPKPPPPDPQSNANAWPPFQVAPTTVREPATQGAPKSVVDADWVIGVEIGGVARAWPLTLIAAHEVVNDTVGGVALAITWCVTCQAPVVFLRKLDDRELTLGNSRTAWRASAVLYDVETSSQWLQSTGEARSGPLAGRFLEVAPSVVRDWAGWRDDHPQGTIVDDAERGPAERERLFLYDARGLDSLGIVLRCGAAARLLPLKELDARTIVEERVGEESILVIYSSKHRMLHAYEPSVEGLPLSLELRRDGEGRPIELVERGGARRFNVSTGAAIVAAGAPATAGLPRRIAYPLRKGRFRDYFPEGTTSSVGARPTGKER